MANETLQREKMSFEELPFESALLPCQNVFDKCTTNTELGNGESFIKNLYTKLRLQMFLHVAAKSHIVTQPRCRLKPFYVNLTHFI